jgi:hypothetical protein
MPARRWRSRGTIVAIVALALVITVDVFTVWVRHGEITDVAGGL